MKDALYWCTGASPSADFLLRTLTPLVLFDRTAEPDTVLLAALRGAAARGGRPSAVLGREDPVLLLPMPLVFAAAEDRLLRREGF